MRNHGPGAVRPGSQFSPVGPQKFILYFGLGSREYIAACFTAIFLVKINPICLAIKPLWTTMFDRLLGGEIPRRFSPYFAA